MTPEEPPPPTPLPAPSWPQRLRAAPVSTLLFACCVVVFVIAERSGSTRDVATLLRFGADSRDLVWKGEWWRLFTAMFLHIGVVHLVWNLWAGFSWTAPFERAMGPLRFAVIYLLSGLAGSALSIIGHDAVSAGASGALFGVMGGVLVIQRLVLGSWAALWKDPGQRRNLLMLVVWLAIGPFVGFDSFAHGGGMLAGAALTWAMLPLRAAKLVPAVLGLLLLIGASLHPIPGLHDEWIRRSELGSLLTKRDWPQVLERTASLATQPDPELAFYRAQALVFSGRVDEAVVLLPQLSGERVQTIRLRALVLYTAGQDARALDEAERGLALDPNDAYLRSLRVSAWVLTGDVEKADAEVERLLKLTPDAPDAIAMHGETLAATHRLEDALAVVTTLSAKAPERAATPRVRFLISLGRLDEAREALRAGPFDDAERAILTCWLEAVRGDFEAAALACDAVDVGHVEWARELKAAMAAGQEDCETARTLLAMPPARRSSRFGDALLGLCALREGDLGEAERRADASLAPYAKSVDGLMLRLAIAQVNGDDAAALTSLRGLEHEAAYSLLWPLLPEQAKQALPRE